MLFLGLVSADTALSRALGEQLKDTGLCQLAVFPSLTLALQAWGEGLPPLLFWDVEDSPADPLAFAALAGRLETADPPPLVLALGQPPAPLFCAEVFSRPLRLGYLLARLQFYVRVVTRPPDVSARLGVWRFSSRLRILEQRAGGEVMRLTDKESDLLAALCQNEGGLSREQLLAEVWGYDDRIDTHTLETHIYRLRRKLAEDGGEDPFLSENGGYKINPLWRGAV